MNLVRRVQTGSLDNATVTNSGPHSSGMVELLVRKRKDCMSSWEEAAVKP